MRTDAETHAKELLSNARKNADRVVAEAREHAEKQISDAMIESERERTSATRQVEDLNRQRESITSYLDELRNLLGHNPDRATLERASRAEAAFEKEQKKATPPAKAPRPRTTKPSTKPARPARPPVQVAARLRCPPRRPGTVGRAGRARPGWAVRGGVARTGELRGVRRTSDDSHDDQNAGKDDATAPSR